MIRQSAVPAEPVPFPPGPATHRRIAYMGALAYRASRRRKEDVEMLLLAEMFIRSCNAASYPVRDALALSPAGADPMLERLKRMRMNGLIRRARAPKLSGPLRLDDAIELVPEREALLAGYFSRYFDGAGMIA